VSPIADHLSATIKATPFAKQPAATLDLGITGIHGEGLTKLSPPLAKTLDGSGMTNGQFEAHVEATLKLDRHSPIDFDLSHPFGAEFDLTNVKYRSAPNSPVLAGIDEVHSEGIRVIPATGTRMAFTRSVGSSRANPPPHPPRSRRRRRRKKPGRSRRSQQPMRRRRKRSRRRAPSRPVRSKSITSWPAG
jgi:hypothetical protein